MTPTLRCEDADSHLELDAYGYLNRSESPHAPPLFDPDLMANWDRFVTHARTPTPELTSSLQAPQAFVLPEPHLRPRSTRYTARAAERRALCSQPLTRCWQGREILGLSQMTWHTAPSGFAATRYADSVTMWRANDVATFLHWALSELRVHRSVVKRVVCVEHLEPLNALLKEQGHPPIQPTPAPTEWLKEIADAGPHRRGLPSFLRAGYSRASALARARPT